MCLGLLCRRRHSLLLCCYCVVAAGSLTLTMKASYTNRWRAELTSSLVTASFCNYKSSMKVKAFVTSRADIKILCCSINQLKPVQTALYTHHLSLFISLEICTSKSISMQSGRRSSLTHFLNISNMNTSHIHKHLSVNFWGSNCSLSFHAFSNKKTAFATGVHKCLVLTVGSLPCHGSGE